MYADIKIYKTFFNYQDYLLVQDDLDRLYTYFIEIKLSFSLSKCHKIRIIYKLE